METLRPPEFGKVLNMNVLLDRYQRKFNYLRLSVIDACNFKCNYCLPNGYSPAESDSDAYLSLWQIQKLVQVFSELGTRKVRITGGEPSLRKDFTQIIKAVAQTQGIEQVATTTNGFKLEQNAQKWRDAGLSHINVSVDSLRPEMFNTITGVDRFEKVMRGVEQAQAVGFERIKINAVLMRSYNHEQIPLFLDFIKNNNVDLRLIELMETGDNKAFFNKEHVSGQLIKKYLLERGWSLEQKEQTAGPAQVYSHPDYLGRFGLILPYEQSFCESCNRLRISSKGRLHLCLFGEQGVDLKDLLHEGGDDEQIKMRISHHLQDKRVSHFLGDGDTGITPHLASIGG